MSYCKNCGTKLDYNEKFCPKCGASLDTEEVGSIPQKPASIVNQTESIVPSSNQAIMQNQTYGNPSASFISPDVQNTVYVAQLEKMSLLSLILLSIVTLGLYGLYYPIRLEKMYPVCWDATRPPADSRLYYFLFFPSEYIRFGSLIRWLLLSMKQWTSDI